MVVTPARALLVATAIQQEHADSLVRTRTYKPSSLLPENPTPDEQSSLNSGERSGPLTRSGLGLAPPVLRMTHPPSPSNTYPIIIELLQRADTYSPRRQYSSSGSQISLHQLSEKRSQKKKSNFFLMMTEGTPSRNKHNNVSCFIFPFSSKHKTNPCSAALMGPPVSPSLICKAAQQSLQS